MADEWIIDIPDYEHELPIRLTFTISGEEWVEPMPGDWSGWWEGKATLTSATSLGHVYTRADLDRRLGGVSVYETRAAMEWSEAQPSPRQMAEDERAEWAEDAA